MEVENEPTSQAQQSITFNDRVAACSVDPRVVAGVASVDTCVGADLFLREPFGGNGRSCGTCHPVDHNFVVDPNFISTLPSTSPLFVAETNPTLAGLEQPATMRKFGLILENLDGFLPDPRTRFVMRSVPHTFSLATSIRKSVIDPVAIPSERTGWSGDGAPGNGALLDFQTGAITQHYTKTLNRVVGTDFRLATTEELRTINTYMRGIGRTNELDITTVAMSDARADNGRNKFLAVGCHACHGNGGANATFTPDGGNVNFNTGVETARNTELAGFPIDGGFLTAPNANGSFGDGTFNAPPLIEAADTGPFFHTAVTVSGASAHNTTFAQTIEEAIAFYDSPAFNNSPAALGVGLSIELTATEIDDIGRFLRGLNAAFNAALAIKRLDAELAVVARFGNNSLNIQNELLRLANVEISDAIRDLASVSSLNSNAQNSFINASLFINSARSTSSNTDRANLTQTARNLLVTASSSIGTNLNFVIGEGTVMF